MTRHLISFDDGAVACRCAQEVREFVPDPGV